MHQMCVLSILKYFPSTHPPLPLTTSHSIFFSLYIYFSLPNISLSPPLALCPVTSCPRCEGDSYIRHVIKREMWGMGGVGGVEIE